MKKQHHSMTVKQALVNSLLLCDRE